MRRPRAAGEELASKRTAAGAFPAVRLGLVGTGRVNRHVIAAAVDSPDVDVVAVASRDSAHAEHYRAGHDLERAYGSYDDLLASSEVDAVYLGLPNSLHVPVAKRALEAGKHVLCEKPLSRRARDAADAVESAKRRGLVLAEGLMYRHHPQTAQMLELVASGAIGTPKVIRSIFFFPLADPDDIRLSAELDGGALMDLGCYCVSAARLLAGEPSGCAASALRAPSGVDLSFHGVLSFATGPVASFDVAMTLPRREELEIIGDEGSLVASSPFHCRAPTLSLAPSREEMSREVEEIAVRRSDPFRDELEAFVAAIRDPSAQLFAGDDIVAQARCIEQLGAAALRTPASS